MIPTTASCVRCGTFGIHVVIAGEDTYLELPTKEFAKVLGLNPQDGLVNLPLLIATRDGEVGEESVRQEAIMSLAHIQRPSRRRSKYFLILVMASCDILATSSAYAVQSCWQWVSLGSLRRGFYIERTRQGASRHFRQSCAVKACKFGLQVKFKFDCREVKLKTDSMSAS